MYGKLFTQMYEGTLASRGPWEALVTFQQLIILANKHGEVDMTADAVSRRTTIPLDVIQRGIVELSAPDPDSRTPDHEGRRIILLDPHRDWGWKIVNYEKYRKIRSEDERREYQRVLMANRRKKLADVSNVSLGSKQYAVSSMQEALESKPSPTKPVGGTMGSPEFKQFWDTYPKRVDRLEALKAWVKGLCDGSIGEILAGLEKWKQCEQWTDSDRIPYPSTWLNKRRWKEVPEKGLSKNEQKRERTKQAIERVRAGLD